MVEQFQHSSLNLSISRFVIIKSFGSNCIDFINKDNRRSLLLCHSKCVSHHLWSVSNIHLYQVRSCQFQESCLCLTCTSSRHHSLSSSRRTKHKTSLGGPDSNIGKLVFVSDGKYDGLSQFLNLFIQSSNISVLLRRFLLELHGLDS